MQLPPDTRLDPSRANSVGPVPPSELHSSSFMYRETDPPRGSVIGAVSRVLLNVAHSFSESHSTLNKADRIAIFGS